MISQTEIYQTLAFLEKPLIDEILASSEIHEFPKGALLIRQGQYIKHLPVVLDGAIKVMSQHDGRELLLYYIRQRQSCIVSFEAAMHNDPSSIFAETDSDSRLLLLPSSKIGDWTRRYPRFNQLFLDLYHQRYLDLLDTVNQLVFKTLDQRLYMYLVEKAKISKTIELDLRHHEIARDLGTAREVITRVLKKLENEGKVLIDGKGIKIL